MKNSLLEHVIGVPINTEANAIERSPKRSLPNSSSQYHIPSTENGFPTFSPCKVDSVIRRADNFARRVREHVKLAPNISETVKGKLSLGSRILQVGGVENIFKQLFSIREGEKLSKTSQCYLSTTTRPIAGLLFISTDRVAFCSERSLKFSTPNGELVRIQYKVMIPLRKIKRANQSANMKTMEKYIEIVTTDNFDFWFMGFFNHQKAFKYLQQAIAQDERVTNHDSQNSIIKKLPNIFSRQSLKMEGLQIMTQKIN